MITFPSELRKVIPELDKKCAPAKLYFGFSIAAQNACFAGQSKMAVQMRVPAVPLLSQAPVFQAYP